MVLYRCVVTFRHHHTWRKGSCDQCAESEKCASHLKKERDRILKYVPRDQISQKFRLMHVTQFNFKTHELQMYFVEILEFFLF